MKLSMWILLDRLKSYAPAADIKNGNRSLRGVRLGGPEPERNDDYLCIGLGRDRRVVCTSGGDSIRLDTDDVNAAVNEILTIFEFYSEWSEDLSGRLWEISSEQELLEMSRKILPGKLLAVSDASHYIHASAGLTEESAKDPFYKHMEYSRILDISPLINIEQDLRLRSEIHHAYVLREPSIGVEGGVRNLFSGHKHQGWLVVINPDGPITQGDMDLQDELGDILEHWMGLHPERHDRLIVTGIFVEILENNYEDRDRISRQLELIGWRAEDLKRVYVIKPVETMPHYDVLMQRLGLLSKGCYSFHYGEDIVTVINEKISDVLNFDDRLSALMQAMHCRAGRGPVFSDIFDLLEQYDLAGAALQFGSSDTPIRDFYDSALTYGLSFIPRQMCPWIVHPALGQLSAYDSKNNTQLYETLRIFLRNDQSYVESANSLHIHRSTLLYRLTRIQDLTGVDLNDADARLYLQVSFHIEGQKKKSGN